jgi:D-alanyl-lipoteichoic acid acyltransferase DltB (MBOAT superfamily)
MAISYVVDTYRGILEPTSLARFAVFQAFFPHLVAGPIVQASELLPQLERPRDPRHVNVSRAFVLIVVGLFLKVVIANHLATHIVDDVFAAPNRHSSLEVLVGIYGYAVQIFADFCGYTNIAIGVALLLGFEFPQNFASPTHRCLVTGLLAALAHDAVALAPRLPLHPARWQPKDRG